MSPASSSRRSRHSGQRRQHYCVNPDQRHCGGQRQLLRDAAAGELLYLATIGNLRHDSFTISVPSEANTYNINSLITSALTFNYTYSPVYEQRVNKGQPDGYVGLIG